MSGYSRELRIVLISGPIAVGKSSIATALLSCFGFEKLSSSRFLVEHASANQLPNDRRTLQDLGDQLDFATDFRWVVDRVAKPQIQTNPNQHLWLMDAVRKQRQVEHFRNSFPGAIFHLHLTASEETLRRRYECRARESDVAIGDYDVIVQHPNEIASRALGTSADLVLDVSALSARDVVDAVASRFEIEYGR